MIDIKKTMRFDATAFLAGWIAIRVTAVRTMGTDGQKSVARTVYRLLTNEL